jgi:hypothetical protein
MAVKILKFVAAMALLASLGACGRGWPDPMGWASTYPHMCLPGWHATMKPDGKGYHCDPNSN